MASANDGQVVRIGLTANGLADLFPIVVAREHVTRLKPAPTPTSTPPHSSPPHPGDASPSRTPTRASPPLSPPACP
ncbi:hypothetical protein [Streptomyces sp. NBC_00234]|uniref:hypothetical protein n=1 Tax=Streptomyces sp. NBC_00234 TaxID=2903638 RepID=UPI003FA6A7C1